MTRTAKYNFKVSVNQHKHSVEETYEDPSEYDSITLFEEAALKLKSYNKNIYTMIELGSNQCYYSLLFKHILGVDNTLNIMVEPHKLNFDCGVSEFKLNNCYGIFYKRGIGYSHENSSEVEPIFLDDILKENNIEKIDMLHSDIDGSEVSLLDLNRNFFIKGKSEFIFLYTHGESLAELCKNIFKGFPYKLLIELPHGSQGGDGLLVFHKLA